MAGVNVDKRVNMKEETKRAIIRLKNGSLHVLNREKLSEKFKARIRNEREHLLDKRRDLAQLEFRKIATDILHDEFSSTCLAQNNREVKRSKPSTVNLDEELLLEEVLDGEMLQEYEDWIEREYNSFLLSEEPSEDSPLVCPVCCRQCLSFTSKNIECDQCKSSYPPIKTIEALRTDINANLADHNSNCCCHPQFTNICDNTGRNSLLMMCNVCLYFNVIL